LSEEGKGTRDEGVGTRKRGFGKRESGIRIQNTGKEKEEEPQDKKIPLSSPFCKGGKRGIFLGRFD
jgi:hypothetical protein